MSEEKNSPPACFRFERIEKKFRIRPDQYEALLPTLAANTVADAFGETTVCSVYYDTPDFLLIRRSVERPKFKEKLRLRSYGFPDENQPVFVELKRKLNGIGYKRRIRVPLSEAKKLLSGTEIACTEPQIMREILEFVRRYAPSPRVFLTYRRYALYEKDNPDFRITVDRDLRFRTERAGDPDDFNLSPVLKDDRTVLLEIKSTGGIPRWLTERMSALGIYQAPFSKVGYCFTEHIAGKTKFSEIKDKEGISVC